MIVVKYIFILEDWALPDLPEDNFTFSTVKMTQHGNNDGGGIVPVEPMQALS